MHIDADHADQLLKVQTRISKMQTRISCDADQLFLKMQTRLFLDHADQLLKVQTNADQNF